ncbi:acyltransferase domain-containing protein, partial [Actinomadura sp. GTD37]|uniref:acyltransferase domain-containing protein n=1 Tax=Actinomadura sp. GTD37 TaxID=1778030 RepID=UPI0035C09471
LWQHTGIHPDAVIGHSQGEIAAAHIAGALTLDDAAKISALRSQTLTRLAGTGTMLSIPLPPHQLPPHTNIAAINSPTTTVISGPTQQLHQLHTHYQNQGIDARLIPVDYASHSPHIEPLHQHILTQLATINPQPATTPFHSTLTTNNTDTTTLTPEYWYQNLRHTVQFHPTIQKLLNTGHTTYIETSPHPVLTTAIQQTADTTPHTINTIPTTHRNKGTHTHYLHNAAQAHTHGTPWKPTTTHTQQTPTNLPTYPFQHHRYWL